MHRGPGCHDQTLHHSVRQRSTTWHKKQLRFFLTVLEHIYLLRRTPNRWSFLSEISRPWCISMLLAYCWLMPQNKKLCQKPGRSGLDHELIRPVTECNWALQQIHCCDCRDEVLLFPSSSFCLPSHPADVWPQVSVSSREVMLWIKYSFLGGWVICLFIYAWSPSLPAAARSLALLPGMSQKYQLGLEGGEGKDRAGLFFALTACNYTS